MPTRVALSPAAESAAGARPTSRKRFYMPELDALRLLAFLMVFFHHMPTLAHVSPVWGSVGSAGMCIFFMLSAFLITQIFLREMQTSGSLHVARFYLRRALRIWPLYFVAVGIGLLAGELIPRLHLPGTAVPYLLLMATNFFVMKHGWDLGIIGTLWSLAIEEQFYLFVPWIAKWGQTKWLALFSCVVIVAANVAVYVLAGRGAVPITQVWVNTLVQSQYFAMGTLLGILLYERRWNMPLLLRPALAIGCLLLLRWVLSFAALDASFACAPLRLLASYVAALLACTGILLSFLGFSRPIPRVILYLGRISYGLYIFHDMVLRLVFHGGRGSALAMEYRGLSALLCLGITVLLATASYHLLELRLLRFKERFAIVRSGASTQAQPSA